ncbi:hypothetical protein PACTADRAFT_73448 [Pachysolen tannophilus NRRL Y-2460]|uniref:t-SNARE coiled-coil homology domain-containing protein n=1 Tax=Pachysolen tannophilus NRRL Y-2460 TaxID=669874 RepID=A0A1E4U186_PACTA|nr:hypothetical protein PACTADRAFT_73448 [Pachysolen tannophilus NRRL Y-2460]
MSSSTYAQRESENNERFDALASKISTFRKVTQDVHDQSLQDQYNLDAANSAMSSFLNKVKNTSNKLARVINANSNTFRMIGIGLLAFFILWTLFKFW